MVLRFYASRFFMVFFLYLSSLPLTQVTGSQLPFFARFCSLSYLAMGLPIAFHHYWFGGILSIKHFHLYRSLYFIGIPIILYYNIIILYLVGCGQSTALSSMRTASAFFFIAFLLTSIFNHSCLLNYINRTDNFIIYCRPVKEWVLGELVLLFINKGIDLFCTANP